MQQLRCYEVKRKKSKVGPMYFKEGEYVSEGKKGFVVGFTVSVVASVMAMYIFSKYITEQSAAAAVRKYVKEVTPNG